MRFTVLEIGLQIKTTTYIDDAFIIAKFKNNRFLFFYFPINRVQFVERSLRSWGKVNNSKLKM